MPVLNSGWMLEITAEDVLSAQAADAAVISRRSPQLLDVALRASLDALGLLAPMVIYRELAVLSHEGEVVVLEGGHTLTGALLCEHLEQAQAVVVAICTIGDAVERMASDLGYQDISYSFALDSAGSVAADLLAKQACHYFEDHFMQKGWRTTIPFNPGMVGWPLLQGQQEIFRILSELNDCVALGESGFMAPLKSVSIVLGAGPEIEAHGSTCSFCTYQNRCHFKVLNNRDRHN